MSRLTATPLRSGDAFVGYIPLQKFIADFWGVLDEEERNYLITLDPNTEIAGFRRIAGPPADELTSSHKAWRQANGWDTDHWSSSRD